jgi:PAS domain S-box-containing protein
MAERSSGLNEQEREGMQSGQWEIILKGTSHVAPNSHIWSDETFRLFGYEPGAVDVSIELFFRHIHPDDLLLVKHSLELTVKSCLPVDLKYRIVRSDGSEVYVHDVASCEYYLGSKQWVKVSGTISDISEIVKGKPVARNVDSILEEAVRKMGLPENLVDPMNSSQRKELERVYYPELVNRLDQTEWHLMESQRIAHIGSWQLILKDIDSIVPGSYQWSDEVFRMFGYEPQEVPVSIETFIKHVHQKDEAQVLGKLREAIANCSDFEIEHRAIRKDGSEIIVLEKGECSRYLGSQQWVKIVGTIRDITTQKKAEHYEASLSSIFENTGLAYTLLDTELDIVLFNEAAYNNTVQHVGKKLAEGRNFLDYVNPERQEATAQLYRSVLKGENRTYEISFGKQGEARWFQTNVFPVRLGSCQISGLAIAVEDITERKAAEETIKAERAKYQALFEHNADAILLTECDGDVLDANPKACELFGMSEEELCKRGRFGLVDTSHPNLRPMLKERQLTGHVKGELNFIRKDNSKFPGILTSVVYQDTNGERRTSMIVQDITEQKAAEGSLRQQHKELARLLEHLNTVREEERTTVAREVHDELGSQLTTMKMGVSLLKERLEKKGLSDEGLFELLDEINQAIKSVRRISSSLHPMILDQQGLIAAVRWYMAEFTGRHGIECQLDIDLEEEIKDPKIGIVLFRILQESLTNILRHAESSKIWVSLRRVDSEFHMTVADNGVGIEKTQHDERDHFGVISMRQRAESVGGRFDIGARIPKGTLVEVSMPVGESLTR